MRILIIGSGGREHALVWKLSQSPLITKIFVAPGNGGTEGLATNVNIKANEIDKLVNFCVEEKIDFVVPGPEQALTEGIADYLKDKGIPCFGPDRYCAQIEGSKNFAKEIMYKANVPTAEYHVFDNATEAQAYIEKSTGPWVIKADGLAAGKGVIVTASRREALKSVEDMLIEHKFGNSGNKIIIEEKLEGEEVSLLCFCDGTTAKPLPSAQDHKAAFDEDLGPNTGGMGAYSPAPILPDDQLENMADIVIRPILKVLADSGHPFKGILYAGLMITDKGPKVLEYNARFGDPECQPLLSRLKSDLCQIILSCLDGTLSNQKIAVDPRSSLGVVLCAEGYPDSYAKGLPISGLPEKTEDVIVFHSGTTKENGAFKSSGGRVLCVTALGNTLCEARDKAYDAIQTISMPKSRYRKDIGEKGIRRINNKHL